MFDTDDADLTTPYGIFLYPLIDIVDLRAEVVWIIVDELQKELDP